ncbi:hypothetical protein [Nocardia farcinica]|uniref:hypothetical protein n=1 Tax=Nocardia farcinica TaxID=37329 RepID=UPI002158C2BD|nr:hypothetical protein [Nocardia farcinica]
MNHNGGFEVSVTQRFRRAAGAVTAESYCCESRDSGKLVSREEGRFHGTRHIQFGGALQPFPSKTMPLLGAATLLRGMEFRKGAKTKVDLWLAFSVHWPAEAKVEKRTLIDVPVGRVEAWEVRIRPSFAHINGLLDKMIQGLLPPFIAHFDAAAGHRLLRFSFPTGPLPWHPRGLLAIRS